ncbi:MAG: 30S ribosomal protein S8 [Candidatus Improbicoccus devescovinae]|nr:MAG: 30S ribosomal protein S8 [Candidatus Improbicoccus devescovinae]
MQVTDSIADLLTRIRNASSMRHDVVEVPASGIKKEIVRILAEEGYIRKSVFLGNKKQGNIKITLKYDKEKVPALTGLKRISKPSLRIYRGVAELPKVMRGAGIAIVSTPKGVVTDRKARKLGAGGEVIAYVW